MSRELIIPVGVIAEKRKAISQWADDYWVPSAIFEGAAAQKPGEVIRQEEKKTVYFMGFAEIFCHATETESYVHNFDSRDPAVYVVLRRDDENEHPLPWYVHMVSVSPYEALDYTDSAEEIVERVQMPNALYARVLEFTSSHHVEQPFKKRQRKDFKNEKPKFGKEPIFLERGRPKSGGGLDG